MATTTRVLLLRHGQSEWNAVGRWQGHADPPLTALGRAQALAASRALGTLDAAMASDLVRARETAEVVTGQLGVGPVLIDERLRERDAGEWTGLTRAEIDEQYPGYLADGRRPPGWEDAEILAARVFEALRAAHATFTGGDVLAVTHSGVIRAVELALGHDGGVLPNLGARWVWVDDKGMALGDRLQLIDANSVAASVNEA